MGRMTVLLAAGRSRGCGAGGVPPRLASQALESLNPVARRGISSAAARLGRLQPPARSSRSIDRRPQREAVTMRRRWLAAAAVVAALSVGSLAPAAPDSPAKPAVDALRKQESVARGKAADEMLAVARAFSGSAAYDDARQALAVALALNPDNASAKGDLAKIKAKQGKPPAAAVAAGREKRTKALAKCADLLAPVA